MLSVSSSLPERMRLFLEGHSIDITICDYLVGVAEEVVNGSMDVDEYLDLVLIMTRDMASFERVHLISCVSPDELEERAALLEEDNKPQQFYEPEKLSSLMQKTAISNTSGNSQGCQHQAAKQEPRKCCVDVSVLRDVTGCKDACDEFLEHVVQEHHGSLEATVDYILDCPNLAQEEAQWALKRVGGPQKHDSEKVQREQQVLKKSIVENYAFADARPGEGSGAVPWGERKSAAKQNDTGKVRYRDGIKVTSKGEKHVYEQVQTDWDGGSRGKVYTKGKRGKGFQ